MNDRVNQAIIGRMIIEAATRINMQAQTQKLRIQLENKLRRLFAQQSLAFQRRFAKYQNEFTESAIDDLDRIFDATAPTDRMSKSIQDNVESAVQTGADALLDQLGELGIKYAFDLQNPRAIEYLKNYGANLVTGIEQTSKDQLRNILENAISAGWSYGKTVAAIRRVFGDWSTRRAKLIAVTELGNGYQEGNLIVGLDLQAAGLNIEKFWLTRKDDKVDPHCTSNEDDGWIAVDQTHSSGAMRPLDHPGCRCVELYRRKTSE